MIAVIALGLLAMLACLAFQVLASVFAARYFARTSLWRDDCKHLAFD